MTTFRHGKFVSSEEHGKPEEKPEHQAAPQEQDGDEPTQPHPETGVHEVHIKHHGPHATTHTHHADGHVEKKKHANLAEAHAHAKQMLPHDEEAGEKNESPAEEMAEMHGAMSGLDGGSSY